MIMALPPTSFVCLVARTRSDGRVTAKELINTEVIFGSGVISKYQEDDVAPVSYYLNLKPSSITQTKHIILLTRRRIYGSHFSMSEENALLQQHIYW